MTDGETAGRLRAGGYLTAAEAARRLGVKPATLYAYVSRGRLTARRAADARTSFFHPDDVERLRARSKRRDRPDVSISSAITLIGPDGLYYRGEDVVGLAAARTYEEVASFLWRGEFEEAGPWEATDDAVVAARAAQASLPDDALPLDRLSVAVAAIAPADPLRFDVGEAAVAHAAPRLIAAMVEALPAASRAPTRARVHDLRAEQAIAGRLAAALARGAATPELVAAVNAALVLFADHELASSTLAARVAASTRAPIYAAVAAGLAIMQGPHHGAASLWDEDILAEIASGSSPERVVAEHLRRGQPLAAAGPYEGGDPRAKALLALVLEHAPKARTKHVSALLAFRAERRLPPADAELALGALAHGWRLVRGAGQAIFAVARTAGWIAHALEEYADRSHYRARARYTGPPPAE